ncbi:ATP-dependent Clp protease ATP-binding subunit [Streptomyces hirsutus]
MSDELKQHFRPEFLNRVDDVVVFPQLTPDDILAIVDLMIDKVDERLKDRDMGIELSQPAEGARCPRRATTPLWVPGRCERTIQREIEDSLSEKILFGELRPGHIARRGNRGRGVRARSSPSVVRRTAPARRSAD